MPDLFTDDMMNMPEDLEPKEKLRMEISDAYMQEDMDLLEELLYEYESEFGQDRFWYLCEIDYLEALDKSSEMKAKMDEAVLKFGEDSLLDLRYARYYFYCSQYEKALEYAEKANFEQDLESSIYLNHIRGYSYVLLEDYKKAVNAFEDILMDFFDPRTALLCGLCYEKQGRHKRAMEMIEQALEKLDDEDLDLVRLLAPYGRDPQKIAGNMDFILYHLTHMPGDDLNSLDFMENLENISPHELEKYITDVARMIEEHADEFIPALEDSVSQGKAGIFEYLLLGEMYGCINQHDAARDMFLKVLCFPFKNDDKIDEMEMPMRLSALEHLDLEEEAFGYVNQWVQRFSHSPENLMLLLISCNIHFIFSQSEKIIGLLEKMKLDEEMEDVFCQLVFQYLVGDDQFEKAFEYYCKQLQYGDEEIIDILGMLLAGYLGHFDEMEQIAEYIDFLDPHISQIKFMCYLMHNQPMLAFQEAFFAGKNDDEDQELMEIDEVLPLETRMMISIWDHQNTFEDPAGELEVMARSLACAIQF